MDLKTEIINTKNGVEIYPYTTRSGDIIMIKTPVYKPIN